MKRTFRIGAVASTAVGLLALLGAQADGANAKDPGREPMLPQPVQVSDANQAQPEIRFVSNEVVQALPETSVEAEQAPTSGANSLYELVASTQVNYEFSREMRCLAQGVYFESRGEPLAGQLAVAQVIVNRAESSLFPNDYCSVITQRAQFSFVRAGHIPEPNTGSAAWQRAKAIARIAHGELWQSEAQDALFFHATHVRPRWASRKVARATIDRHVFYR